MAPLPKGRPTYCAVDLARLRWNFLQVRKKVGSNVKILSIVKANAYGHGAGPVAQELAAAGSDGFGVATLEEAVELREAGIRSPIIILAGIYPDQLDEILRHRLTMVLSDLETLERLERALRRRGASLSFHLKVDTGMGRLGLPASATDSWLSKLARLTALRFDGLCSHFADAESEEEGYTRHQLRSFTSVIERLRRAGLCPPLIHMALSAAVITLPGSYFSMVRPGLVLYGVHPTPATARRMALKPVLSWKSGILQLKSLPKGSSISYGRTYVTKRPSQIATLPVGYADGYHRLLSNRAAVLVRGRRAPVVGRVCMDLTMIDVTDIRGVKQGDEAVLLGSQGKETITAEEMAAWAETISYEVFTSISARVPRVHYSSKEE
jgi:alanine racemase